MRIGHVAAAEVAETDRVLALTASRLSALGRRVVGAVQVVRQRPDGGRDMALRLLPDGPLVDISEDRGPGAAGCQLDPAALETAVGLAGTALAGGADVLIVNRFGKSEAQGDGFRDLIALACLSGIPVLVAVSPALGPAFEEFTGGGLDPLPSDPEALAAWVLATPAGPLPPA